jgi:ABC-type uncharacterized transport system involved in gliding motility auxiliary subunit
MFINNKNRWLIRFSGWFFVLIFTLLIGLLAWLSVHYSIKRDWTQPQRHTLSAASQAILAHFKEELLFRIYVTENESLKPLLREIIAPYERAYSPLIIEWINPHTVPMEVRELEIQNDGELFIHYQGRYEQLRDISEETITNALQRLIRPENRYLTFLTGHGERSPEQFAPHDVTDFADHLRSRGFIVDTHHFGQQGDLPEETGLLVLASVRSLLLAGEIAAIKAYLDKGGNLLWLLDPDSHGDPAELLTYLGVEKQSGVMVDLNSQLLGVNNPTLIALSRYGKHPLVADFAYMTLFPEASGLTANPPENWSQSPFLLTSAQTWLEQHPQQKPLQFDADQDISGPLALGLALTRNYDVTLADNSTELLEQRIILIGDGDFLSNTYLNNGGNLDFGLRLVNWLVRDEQFIAIPARTGLDQTLSLNSLHASLLGLFFLIILPIALFSTGFIIYAYRKRSV